MIHVIYNPVAGPASIRRIDDVRRFFAESSLPHRILETAGPGDAVFLARAAAAAGADTVVAVGGDGTINEVANGLAGSRTRMAIVPHGTGNVFARELDLPASPEGCLALLTRGKTIEFRLARAQDRYFALLASAGFDAEVVERVTSRWKNRLGVPAYVLAGLRHLFRPQPSLWLEFPGRERMEAQAVVLCRARKYAGGVRMAPDADLADDALHVVVLARMGRAALLMFTLDALRGRHLSSRNVRYRVTRSLWVRSRIPSAAQVDGEYMGPLPVRFEMTDVRLRLVVPEGYATGAPPFP